MSERSSHPTTPATKCSINPRQDEKLPDDSDIQDQTLSLIPRQICIIDTFIPYEEYSIDKPSLNIGPLTSEQGQKFRYLLEEFADLFATDITKLGQTSLVTYRIYTENIPPIRSCPYSIPPSEQIFVKEELQ